MMSLADSLLKDPRLEAVTGDFLSNKNIFTYWTSGSPEQATKNRLKQLKAQLSLEAREKLKGSGAVSDFESRTLERSVSALDGNLRPADSRKELARLKGSLANASGLPALVKVTNPRTGESSLLMAYRENVNQALIDGMEVDYTY